MDLQIGNPNFAYLIGFAALAIVLAIANLFVRKRASSRFASAELRKQIMPNNSTLRRIMSALLIAMTIAMVTIALMDLRWGKTMVKVPQKGIEVIFALDVSRSMLAQDASPNRLARAKQQIKDMIDEMTGDRVGLVVFAGEAKQSVPLTSHYDDFKQILDTVGPQSIPVGGSQLGAAIQQAADGFIAKTNDHKTIVLFTDGEDQASKPVELAKKLHAKDGTRIFTVGLGDLEQGSRIPNATPQQPNQFVEHNGQQVWSKLNGQILRSIATQTNGAYIPAGTKHVNMADVYHQYITDVEQTEFETAKINAYIPRFQWFAGVGLALLLLEAWLTTRPAKKPASVTQQTPATSLHNPSKIGTATILIAVSLSMPAFATPAFAQTTQTVPTQINTANQLLRDEKAAEAIVALSGIDDAAHAHQDELTYNLAVAHYRNHDYQTAQTLFAQSALSANTQIAADSRYNSGNCHYKQALLLSQPTADSQTPAPPKPPTQENAADAIKQLESAIANYRSSLRLNQDNTDARANIELANRLIRELKKQQEQQQQQQQKEDQKENDPNDDQQKQENQENQDDEKSGDGESKDNQESKPSQEENQGKDSKNESDQQSNDKEAQQPGDESETGESSDPNTKPPEQNSQQPPGADEPDNPQPSETEPNQDQAADQPNGDLTAANQDTKPVDKPGDEKQPAAQTTEGDKAGFMTREEALKMLQSVRDRDLLRRLRQQHRLESRRAPVEKDW